MKKLKTYTTPEIDLIKLDNEISLQLASSGEALNPPTEPNFSRYLEEENNDPYRWGVIE